MMKFHPFTVNLADLINCIFHALELVSPSIARHHNQTAYISQHICNSLKVDAESSKKITLAASLHDIGALALGEDIDDLRFEDENIDEHSLAGSLLLKHFPPLSNLAPLFRYHHQHWHLAAWQPEQVPFGSYIIYLADRISILINEDKNILFQQQRILNHVRRKRGTVFHPKCVDAFLEIAGPEYFWLDLVSLPVEYVSSSLFQGKTVELDERAMLGWAKFLSRMVDFRSPFNASHSSGVAASAAALAELAGFSKKNCHKMLVAGYLHDIGKITVPTAILEKKGPLNNHERSIIDGHPYYTYRILEHVKELNTIANWAALHHERLDGMGYPFRIREPRLPLGSQVMAAADIFTALNERRTYRPAMEKDKCFEIMYKMARDKAINGDLVRLLEKNFEEVNTRRIVGHTKSALEYRAMNPLLGKRAKQALVNKGLGIGD